MSLQMRRTVNGTRSLSIFDLRRRGLLVPRGDRCPWVLWIWRTEEGTPTRMIFFRIERKRPELQLVFFARDHRRIQQNVEIIETQCKYGGSRPWFYCPCGRRVAALFDGINRFVCRHCMRLAYTCQQQNARYRPMLR